MLYYSMILMQKADCRVTTFAKLTFYPSVLRINDRNACNTRHALLLMNYYQKYFMETYFASIKLRSVNDGLDGMELA